MEPWDGPASIAFTDGRVIGAVLDRNGLRPSRYVVTKDGLVVMASEVGVLDIAPENVAAQGPPAARAACSWSTPSRAASSTTTRSRRRWRRASRTASGSTRTSTRLDDLPRAAPTCRRRTTPETLLDAPAGVRLHDEDLRILMAPMAINGKEAVGSMGTDTPLAVLSDRPQLLFNYFKQLFAQVTNPPIDPIREELVMSVETTIGAGAEPVRRDARSTAASSS